jgi:hypothetical protein
MLFLSVGKEAESNGKEDKMSHKEVDKVTCNYCESSYKVLYDYEETQGQPRFCSFCGEECFDEDEVELENDDE